jgi:hypothetical protein
MISAGVPFDSSSVNDRDIGVIQRGKRLCLAFESHQSIVIERKCLREDLDGDRTVQARVAGLVDLTHTPSANEGEDFIRP